MLDSESSEIKQGSILYQSTYIAPFVIYSRRGMDLLPVIPPPCSVDSGGLMYLPVHPPFCLLEIVSVPFDICLFFNSLYTRLRYLVPGYAMPRTRYEETLDFVPDSYCYVGQGVPYTHKIPKRNNAFLTFRSASTPINSRHCFLFFIYIVYVTLLFSAAPVYYCCVRIHTWSLGIIYTRYDDVYCTQV